MAPLDRVLPPLWHPPTGKGVRALFSDDYLWLKISLDDVTV